MMDIFLEADVNEENLEAFLLARMKSVPQDAILRLKTGGRPDPRVLSRLTGRYLRELFPKTMNVELGSDFARRGKDGPG